MANSTRKTILEYLKDTTLPLIISANGYNTDIQTVKRGIESIDVLPDSGFPACYITATRAVRKNITGVDFQSKMQVIIECYVKRTGDTDDLQVDLDNFIEDVTKALEQDRTLNNNCAYLDVLEITTDDGDLDDYGAAAILVEVMYTAKGTTP